MLAADYAKALYELGGKKEQLASLQKVLERRGHAKLLPNIAAEYKKLLLRDERLAKHKQETPKQAQTRNLLELYRKLTA
ncbi:MAG TPA: hypothetical protein VGP13_03255 [Candidatus Paceibacterota bacterium]|jgi:hypothetical protein|nr:hypothetical protein [Candidatus Paceibacterota bacterium]